MSTASRVIKNTGFLYVRIAITIIVALWTTRIILNALGEDNFGVYSLVGGVVSLLGFLNASLSGATQRFINIYEGKADPEGKKIIFNNSLTLHTILAVSLIFLLLIVGVISFEYILEIPPSSYFAAKCVYACMIVTTVISVLNVPYEAEINAHEDMGVYAVVGIIDAVLKLAIAFTINHADTDRLILYGFLMMGVPIMTLCVLASYCHRHYKECVVSPRRYFRKEALRQLSGFAGWNFINTATGIISQSGLNLVINHFFGVALNAAQGITYQVGSALMNLSSNVEKALNPILVKREGANQRDGMLYVSLLGCRMTFFIFTFFSLFVASEMAPILRIWLKEVPEWTVLFCQLQLVRVALELITRGVHMAIMAQGDIKMYCICRSITNILPLFLTIWAFANNMAPYWMYIIWIISWSIIGGGISLWFAHRNIGLQYRNFNDVVLCPIIKVTLPAMLIIVACRLLTSNQAIGLCMTLMADLLFFVMSFRYLFTSSERDEIKRIIVGLQSRLREKA